MEILSRGVCLEATSPVVSVRAVAKLGGGRKSAIRGAAAVAVAMVWASAAQAQCAATGPIVTAPHVGPNETLATVKQGVVEWTPAIASASSGVATLIASINAVNTAFLTQSSAFIGSPPNPRPDQEGGGVWVRGVGGQFTFNTYTTAGNLVIEGPQQGSINCNNRTQENFAGVQVGADFARLNVNGWNLHAGLTTGYLGSQNRDGTSEGLNPAASFQSSLQVPFAGIYGAASYGGFLFDGQVRGDFYQSAITDVPNGLLDQHAGAKGFSVTGNVAYQFNLGNDWFVEPSAGFVWTRIYADPLNYAGTIVTGAGPNGVPPWTLNVNDIDSTLGRLSLRAGTTVRMGNMMVLQPFASIGVFHDFEPYVTSALSSNFTAAGQRAELYTSTIMTDGIGTYGQFGLGVAAQLVDTGWAGYFRGDYRKGNLLEGWTLNGGLRYQFTPEPVRRSPMITKAPVYKAQAAYDWTGFYIGANVGADFGFTTWNFGGGTINPHFAGFLGGGDIGYNYQVGRWVLGVEGSAGWTNANGATACAVGFFYNCEVGLKGLHTVTGRVGYAWDRLLGYVKAGAVIAQEQTGTKCDTNSMATIVAITGCPGADDSRTRVGWTTGLGYEFALTRNISARGEILYFDLGSDSHNLFGGPSSLQRSGVMSTLGLHYRFGG
ncbi:MAG: autotransporter domain-containing protein [Bradyrhizobiaceae bacterium]|nr:autotransporter domain-containing protein [Bradyrhizobiaceae bacterium]